MAQDGLTHRPQGQTHEPAPAPRTDHEKPRVRTRLNESVAYPADDGAVMDRDIRVVLFVPGRRLLEHVFRMVTQVASAVRHERRVRRSVVGVRASGTAHVRRGESRAAKPRLGEGEVDGRCRRGRVVDRQ
ncbi:hypothetical protein GCM10010415_29760 [Streptomyces atrovirens]